MLLFELGKLDYLVLNLIYITANLPSTLILLCHRIDTVLYGRPNSVTVPFGNDFVKDAVIEFGVSHTLQSHCPNKILVFHGDAGGELASTETRAFLNLDSACPGSFFSFVHCPKCSVLIHAEHLPLFAAPLACARQYLKLRAYIGI